MQTPLNAYFPKVLGSASARQEADVFVMPELVLLSADRNVKILCMFSHLLREE